MASPEEGAWLMSEWEKTSPWLDVYFNVLEIYLQSSHSWSMKQKFEEGSLNFSWNSVVDTKMVVVGKTKKR